MKKLLYIVLVTVVSFTFLGCGGTRLTTASSAPTSMKLPSNLSQNEDALYYNKLINQYITNPDSIAIKDSPKKDKIDDKKLKQSFLKEFEKAGLSRQDAIKAYRKQKKVAMNAKLLVKLPKNATIGTVNTIAGRTSKMLLKKYGKAITNKPTKVITINYNIDDKEKVIQKYNELIKLFEQLLPPSQHWKKTTENTTAGYIRKNIKRMENFYAKYKGDYSMLPDPKGYKKSIKQQKESLERTLNNPFTFFKYAWSSNQRIGGTITGSSMPNTITIMIRPVFSKKTDEKSSNIVNVIFVKVLY